MNETRKRIRYLKHSAVTRKQEREQPGREIRKRQRKRQRICFWTWPWGHVYKLNTYETSTKYCDTFICEVCSKTKTRWND